MNAKIIRCAGADYTVIKHENDNYTIKRRWLRSGMVVWRFVWVIEKFESD